MATAKFVLAVMLVLVGTDLLTYHVTRESTFASIDGKMRSGHKSIVRGLFAEHEKVPVSGLELQRQLIKTELKVSGVPSARHNLAVGSCYPPFMMIVTGVLLPFVKLQRGKAVLFHQQLT